MTTQTAVAAEPVTGHRSAMAWIALLLGCLTLSLALVREPVGAASLAVLLPFVCFGPGLAFASLIRLGDWVSSWAMALVLSLALAGVAADAMLWARQWHPLTGYVALAVPTVITAAIALVVDPSRGGHGPAVGPRPQRSAAPAPRLSDETSVLPRFAAIEPSAQTSVLPRITDRPPTGSHLTIDHGGDATAVLPRWRDDRPDARVVIVAGQGGGDQTTVLPRIVSTPAAQTSATPAARTSATPTRLIAAVSVELAIAAGVVGLWLWSLTRSDVSGVDDYGLLWQVHPAFFAAIALCVLRFVVELARRHPRGMILTGHTVLLVLIMHATVPLLIAEPEYAWTYKHVGVVELFLSHGQITNPDDLYQQWPTFFAVVAQLVAASGVGSLPIAAWAPAFFDLVFCLPIIAIARTLSADRRVPYLTVFIFSAANWVAQDYLSAQAFTYLLGLGTTLIMARWLRRTNSTAGGKIPAPLARLWAWVGRDLVEVPYAARYARRSAMAVLCLVYAVVVTSHQLSPYVIVMSAGALVGLGLVRPVWIVPIFLAIAVAFLLPRLEVVDNYGLFNGFNFFSNAQAAKPVAGTSAARVFSAHVAQLLSLVVWGLAALAVVASRRRLGPVAAPAVLAFSPFALLLAQSYGGEAIYRVYLFSIPWCSLLIATLVLRSRWLPRGLGVPGAAIVLTAAALASMQGAHGQLGFNRFTTAEVRASQFIYNHAEPGADIVLAAGNFPTRLTATYGAFASGPNSDRSLLNPDEDLVKLHLNERDLPTINANFDAEVPTYLVFSPSMRQFLHYFGYAPDGAFDRLQALIARSPQWRLFHQDGDVVIFVYVPAGRAK